MAHEDVKAETGAEEDEGGTKEAVAALWRSDKEAGEEEGDVSLCLREKKGSLRILLVEELLPGTVLEPRDDEREDEEDDEEDDAAEEGDDEPAGRVEEAKSDPRSVSLFLFLAGLFASRAVPAERGCVGGTRPGPEENGEREGTAGSRNAEEEEGEEEERMGDGEG